MPQPVRRALEIGCGAGDTALTLARQGWFTELDAFDVAEGAVAAAQAKAAAAGLPGLNFFVADGNTLALRPGAYDLIYANHALHHITDLEHLFAQCAAALAPGGLLFASDYIGPSRMQYSDAHLALMNDALARIPPEKRADACHGGRMKWRIGRTPLQAFLDLDPSEAPRSAEIVPALRRHFEVEVVPYGMSLTYEVLLGLIHHFDPDDDADNALLDRLLALDRAAEAGGQVDTLFATLVATPRAPASAAGEGPGAMRPVASQVGAAAPRTRRQRPASAAPQPAASPEDTAAARTGGPRQGPVASLQVGASQDGAAAPSTRRVRTLEAAATRRVGRGPSGGGDQAGTRPGPRAGGTNGPTGPAGTGVAAHPCGPDACPPEPTSLASSPEGAVQAAPPDPTPPGHVRPIHTSNVQAPSITPPAAPAPEVTVPDFAALGLAGPADGPGFHTVAGIEGWLEPDAAGLTARLCRLQAALGTRSGVLELGVYRGKYLALLAALHRDAGVPVLGVDMFIQRIGEAIATEHVPYFTAVIVDAVLHAAPGTVPLVIAKPTAEVPPGQLLEHCPAGFSFVSVDAGHEVGDVVHDLGLAASVLAPAGIVALDDAFHGALPGVSEGLIRYLLRDAPRDTPGDGPEEGGLAAFAFCGNKLFLCRPGFHAAYLAYARWLAALPDGEGYLARTAAQHRADGAVGFTPRLAGRELVAFVPLRGAGAPADDPPGQGAPAPAASGQGSGGRAVEGRTAQCRTPPPARTWRGSRAGRQPPRRTVRRRMALRGRPPRRPSRLTARRRTPAASAGGSGARQQPFRQGRPVASADRQDRVVEVVPGVVDPRVVRAVRSAPSIM